MRMLNPLFFLSANLTMRTPNISSVKATKGGGQILVCVGGRGYYQEWGKEPVELLPGDAVYISAGVKHWHGAAPDSWFSHLAIEAPGENKSNEWLEPVSEDEYSGVGRHQR